MMNLKDSLLIVIGVLVLFLSGCSSDDDLIPVKVESTTPYDSTYLSSVNFSIRSAVELGNLISIAGIDVDVSKMLYDVSLYRINYTTTYQGSEIIASGLVILPISDDSLSVGVMSFQHGTIFSQAEAPTNTPLSDPYLILYAAAATTGVVMVVPDYIGYGASEDITHPYFIAEPTSTAVLDNIKAGREFAELNGLKFNGELFLAGYSQGGFATMATHMAIEAQDGFLDYNLNTSYPAAGSYIVDNSVSISAEDVFPPHFTTLRIYSYLAHYDLGLVIADFIQEPYAGKIPTLLDGSLTSAEILPSLNYNAGEYFTSEFLLEDSKFDGYLEAQMSNDVSNWVPKARMIMYHSNEDNTVSVNASKTAYDKFKNAGATEITLITGDDGDHLVAVIPFVEVLFNDLVDRL
ncbi:MAG: pimeloyl-ACP methyl ester carboxylesterase [Cyclobacteriaceae bacterium]|jgi:pimeloyl-ACP methyl ester carboxylesterase